MNHEPRLADTAKLGAEPTAITANGSARHGGVDPDSDLGRRLLRKVERMDGYLCLARTRRGTLCIALGSGNGWRCRLHGGASSGPKTDEGRARALANLVQNRNPR